MAEYKLILSLILITQLVSGTSKLVSISQSPLKHLCLFRLYSHPRLASFFRFSFVVLVISRCERNWIECRRLWIFVLRMNAMEIFSQPIITWNNIYAEYVASNIEWKPSNKLWNENDERWKKILCRVKSFFFFFFSCVEREKGWEKVENVEGICTEKKFPVWSLVLVLRRFETYFRYFF